MINVLLYIYDDATNEPQRIELFNDETISVTSSIQDINDISKIFTDFSQSFTVPATTHNNKIFKHWYENSIENGFDARTRKSAYIELDYVSFRKGKIQLEKASVKDGQIENYSITFFGSLISLKDAFGGKYLKDLDFSSINFTYSGADVVSRISTSNDSTVKFPLITSYRAWRYGGNGNTVENWDISKTATPIYHSDLFPAVKLKGMLDVIAANLGITFQGSILENTTETAKHFHHAYLWAKNANNFEIKVESQLIIFQSKYSTTDSYELFDLDTSTLTYVDAGGSTFIETQTLDITCTANGIASVLYVYRNGVKIYALNFTSSTTSQQFELLIRGTGDYTFKVSAASSLTYTSELNFVISDGTSVVRDIQVIQSTSQTTDVLIDLANYMPEIKTEDFFSGVLKMFNLTCYSDSPGVFRIEQLEDWYNAGQIRDISQFIISDNFEIERVTPYKMLNFTYEDSEALLNVGYKQNSPIPYGNLNYSLDNDGDEYSVELPFENMLFGKFTGTNLQVSYALKTDYQQYIPKPVILYDYGTLQTCSAYYINDGSTTSSKTSYNVFGQDSLVTPNVNTLNWGLEISSFTDNVENNTLFNEYYLNYLNNIYTLKARTFKLRASLPISLISSLKMNDRLVIRDKRYIINSFTTNLTNGEVDFTLLHDFRTI
jgi:hypothetical protein